MATRRSYKSNFKTNSDAIAAIKGETVELKKQIRILKTKINLANNKIDSRSQMITKVFSQSKDQQKLSTASDSQIRNLKVTLQNLQNTKSVVENKYYDITSSDQYFHAGELQGEILILFQEYQRLIKDTQSEREKKQQLNEKLSALQFRIKNSREQFESAPDVIKDIKASRSKYETYRKGKQKATETDLICRVNDNISIYDSEKKNLDEIIEDYQKQIDQINEENEKRTKETEEAVNELDQIIEDAKKRIKESNENNLEEERKKKEKEEKEREEKEKAQREKEEKEKQKKRIEQIRKQKREMKKQKEKEQEMQMDVEMEAEPVPDFMEEDHKESEDETNSINSKQHKKKKEKHVEVITIELPNAEPYETNSK